MANLIAKSLATQECPTNRDFLRATMNAMMRSIKVGATQACWFLLGLDFVQKSRTVISVNTLKKSEMAVVMRSVSEMEEAVAKEGLTALAADTSPSSNLGTRLVYESLVKNQYDMHQECNVTYNAFLSRYRLSRQTTEAKNKKKPPLNELDRLLQVDD